jgi:hypothetical protein
VWKHELNLNAVSPSFWIVNVVSSSFSLSLTLSWRVKSWSKPYLDLIWLVSSGLRVSVTDRSVEEDRVQRLMRANPWAPPYSQIDRTRGYQSGREESGGRDGRS